MIALDTNTVIDLGRGHPVVRERFFAEIEADTPMAISTFVLQELLFGAERSSRPERERSVLAPILDRLAVLPFEEPDARAGGRARALMEREGRRAPLGDFIIGVHAMARGYALATADKRGFHNIPGLVVLDWTKPRTEPQD